MGSEDNTLIYGHRYTLAPRKSHSSLGVEEWETNPVPHAEYPTYKYIEPVSYSDDCWMGDCWVVNEAGDICPGYNTSPEPFHINNLVKVQGVRAKHIFVD